MMEYFNKETAEQLTLVAVFKAKPGKRDVLRQALISLIDKTRAEEGSVSYHLYEDREDADRFIFHEIWANETLWKKHMQSEHIAHLLAAAGELFAEEPVIQRWQRSVAPIPVIEPDSLVLFAYNRSLPGVEKKWQKILEDLIAPTLAEKGALHYELHISKEDPLDFMFHETWKTVGTWNDHMVAPHLTALLEIINDYTVNGITVIKTRPIA